MNGQLVVDTCLLIDIAENDPRYGKSSAALIDKYASRGLLVSPVTYFALAPVFNGDRTLENEFLHTCGVMLATEAPADITAAAYRAWANYCASAKGKEGLTAFVPFLVGALALCHAGLLTRRGDLFRKLFPTMNIITE